MPLFQTSVLKKYLKSLDAAAVAAAYEKYTVYFQNPERQTNIRAAKEEQFQEGFLRELFVNILGYTINPEPNFNLTTELKNIKDAKKTDGAILLPPPKADGRDRANLPPSGGLRGVLAVIELKGTDTTDLEKIRDQAFNYKNNQPECQYVITSNFEKLRFYIQNAVEHIEFNLFTLTAEEFKTLWLCLQADNLLNNIPLKAKKDSLLEEENVTKKLYKDYKAFKTDLWKNLVANHPEHNQLWLFKKTQKLLDRFLFIFFAEDKGLLPPNSISQIISEWNQLKELRVYVPIMKRIREYFGYLNVGDKQLGIFAYNGGLFAPDAFLDTEANIDDDIIHQHILKLTNYDFSTEVDVNILGHIFEHSLNEIEEITAELEGVAADKSKGRRKKDGVFYTPKYITKYIVDNTVGKLCSEKKAELGIVDEEYAKGRTNRKTATIKQLDEQLQAYRQWLLSITICDPACGSGAFLNQALEFLITEHSYIDELEGQLLGYAFEFPGVEDHILESNLFGVDINDEAVEIAKLSLWLRTAKAGRKLSSLNKNLKCGNSLIDDPAVAGDKAFNWQQEFPQVFEKGGFDVVIGNPPYVRKQGLMEHYPEMCGHYEDNYASATANYDVYALFMEKSYYLINESGEVSFILPHKFLVADFGVGIRTFFKSKKAVQSLVHFGSEMVFADASTYTCIIHINKAIKDRLFFKKVTPLEVSTPFSWDYIFYDDLTKDNWDLQSQLVSELIQRLQNQPYTVSDVFDRIFQGIASGGDKFFTLYQVSHGMYYSEMLDKLVSLENGILKPFVKGNQISKYQTVKTDYYTLFPYSVTKGKASPLSFREIEAWFPNAAAYYKECETFLRKREKGRFNNDDEWFLFSRKQGISGVEFPKIMTQEISLGCNMTYDAKGEYYHPTTVYSFVKNDGFKVDEKFYLGILNSKLMWFFLKNTGTELRGGYFRFKTNYLKPFPLPEIPANPSKLIENVNCILEVNATAQKISDMFISLLKSKISTDKPSKNLQNWPSLDFKGFLAELKKAKVILTLEEEAEWLAYFTKKKAEVTALQAEITRLDKEIDQMVYALYGLTEEEIRIVEES